MTDDSARIGEQAVNRNYGPDARKESKNCVKGDAGSDKKDPVFRNTVIDTQQDVPHLDPKVGAGIWVWGRRFTSSEAASPFAGTGRGSCRPKTPKATRVALSRMTHEGDCPNRAEATAGIGGVFSAPTGPLRSSMIASSQIPTAAAFVDSESAAGSAIGLNRFVQP